MGQGRSGDTNVIAGPVSTQVRDSEAGNATDVDAADSGETNSTAEPDQTSGITDEELSEFVRRLFLDSSEDNKLSLIQTADDAEAAAVLDTLNRLQDKYGALVNRTFTVDEVKVVSSTQVLVDAALGGESNSGVRALDVYLDVRESDDGLFMRAESFCSTSGQLEVWCYPDTAVVCPVATLSSPSVTLVSSQDPGSAVTLNGSDDHVTRYKTDAEGQEVTMLSSASPEVLGSPVMSRDSAVLIHGRTAGVYTFPGDLETIIIAWQESEECGLYALNVLGFTRDEAISLAQSIELD